MATAGATNAGNVSASKPKIGGAVWRAPLGTTLPTDTTTALDAAFLCCGYVSEDGLTNDNSPTSEDVKAWGGDIVMSIQTEKQDTFKFALIESKSETVIKAVYGDANVTGTITAGMTVKANGTEQAAACWVFDMIMGGTAKRIVVPNGKVSEIGEIVYVDNEPVKYDLTVSALPDTAGNTHYEYIKG